LILPYSSPRACCSCLHDRLSGLCEPPRVRHTSAQSCEPCEPTESPSLQSSNPLRPDRQTQSAYTRSLSPLSLSPCVSPGSTLALSRSPVAATNRGGTTCAPCNRQAHLVGRPSLKARQLSPPIGALAPRESPASEAASRPRQGRAPFRAPLGTTPHSASLRVPLRVRAASAVSAARCHTRPRRRSRATASPPAP